MSKPAELARVTTAMVFDAITAHPIGAFTTFDIAKRMGVPEYPVRAAASWLLKRNLIDKAGTRKRYTAAANEPYWATTYKVREQGGPPDFAALMEVFCRG